MNEITLGNYIDELYSASIAIDKAAKILGVKIVVLRHTGKNSDDICPYEFWSIKIMTPDGSELLYPHDYDTMKDLRHELDLLLTGANLAQGKEV